MSAENSLPNVLLTKDAGKIKPSRDWKSLIMIALILTLVIPVFVEENFGPHLIRNSLSSFFLKFSPQTKTVPKIISQGRLQDLAFKDHPANFYADLEYNPSNGSVVQKRSGKENGDPSPFFSNPPKEGKPEKFIFKVEVISESKEVIQAGWSYVYKEIAQTQDGKILLRINVKYRPKSIIKVYLPNKQLIWTGKMS